MLEFKKPLGSQQDRTERILLGAWIAIAIFALVSLFLLPAEATEAGQETARVDCGIRWLLRDAPHWGLAANDLARDEMAGQIAQAARAHGVPPLLLAVVVYRESSFDVSAEGHAGERGLLQVHGLAARGCDLSTAAGQLDCGARWLATCRETCGDWRGAMSAYVSGRCEPQTKRTQWVATSRLRQWGKAERECK